MAASHPTSLLRTTALAALATLAVSCGRELPNAARTTPQHLRAQHLSAVSGGSGLVADEVVVTLTAGSDPADVAASHSALLLDENATQNVATLAPLAGTDAAGLLSQLVADPRVTTSEPNTFVQPPESEQHSFAFDDGLNTPTSTQAQPALTALRVSDARLVSSGAGVRVAILDTGIDPTHPALRMHIAATWDFFNNTPDATDRPLGLDTNGDGTTDGAYGHGTHVAGIVALTAPGASLLIGRVLDSDGVGDVRTVAAGIRWAADNGAQVINLSLGSITPSTAIGSAIEYAEYRGAVVVASEGNRGAEFPREYPAGYEDVVSVAASDAYGQPAPWASWGDNVALSAPGVAVRSTYPGGLYRQWSGSSMSTPFVTGASALLLAIHPGWNKLSLLARLQPTASPLSGLGPGQLGGFGAGMLNMGAALMIDYVPPPSEDPDAGSDPTGRTAGRGH